MCHNRVGESERECSQTTLLSKSTTKSQKYTNMQCSLADPFSYYSILAWSRLVLDGKFYLLTHSTFCFSFHYFQLLFFLELPAVIYIFTAATWTSTAGSRKLKGRLSETVMPNAGFLFSFSGTWRSASIYQGIPATRTKTRQPAIVCNIGKKGKRRCGSKFLILRWSSNQMNNFNEVFQLRTLLCSPFVLQGTLDIQKWLL